MLVGATATLIGLVSFSAVPAGAGDYWANGVPLDAAAITPVGSVAPLRSTTSVPPTPPSTDAAYRADDRAPTSATEAPTTVPAEPRPVRILVIGDSTAIATGGGLVAWALANPDVAEVSVLATPRCGIVRGGRVLTDQPDDDYLAKCDDLLDHQLPPTIAALQPDVVAVFVAARDNETREWDPDEVHRGRATRGTRRDRAGRHGAHRHGDGWRRRGPGRLGQATTDRSLVEGRRRCVHRRRRACGGRRVSWPGLPPLILRTFASVDLRAWMEASGLADDQDLRPDGIHFTPDAATQVASDWLGPQLVAAALS